MKENYRKMTVYRKSAQVWQREKARRRQVLQLSNGGASLAEISVKLGVCTKTVQRDLKRLKPYLTRLNNEARDKRDAEFSAALDLLPIDLRFRVLAAGMGADALTQWQIYVAVVSHNMPVLFGLLRKKRSPSKPASVRQMSPAEIKREIELSLSEPEWTS